jgi:hypothetical protein
MLVVIIGTALLAPLVAPQDPYDLATLDLMDARQPPGAEAMSGKMVYRLGTDGQGRDMVSAIIYGLRVSLYVGVASGAIALTLGAVLGVLAAYLGGRFEQAHAQSPRRRPGPNFAPTLGSRSSLRETGMTAARLRRLLMNSRVTLPVSGSGRRAAGRRPG